MTTALAKLIFFIICVCFGQTASFLDAEQSISGNTHRKKYELLALMRFSHYRQVLRPKVFCSESYGFYA